MQQCPQTNTQSVYQHGLSVWHHLLELISFLKTGHIDEGWLLPTWMHEYRQQLLSKLLSKEVIEEYAIHHDCGKPYCLTIDEQGRRHFANHSDISYRKWLEVGGSAEAAMLMKMDMDIHQLKAVGVEEFAQRPQAITLLLAGLAEVHSNAKMFGGQESESFKIKWNQINKRGKAICLQLFRSRS